MNYNYRVSVIAPFYNTEEHFEKCLNSLSVAKKFASKDSRIKIITQSHKKQASARSNGTKHTTGEYNGFVDSDYWIDLNYFKKPYNSAKKYDSDIANPHSATKNHNPQKQRRKNLCNNPV